MLTAKCDKYGRNLTIVDRWYPSSQKCSSCGQSGGKKELDIREWECLFCNTVHDRDINAAKNLIKEAGGHSDSKINGRGGSVSQAMLAVSSEASTKLPKQLTLF